MLIQAESGRPGQTQAGGSGTEGRQQQSRRSSWISNRWAANRWKEEAGAESDKLEVRAGGDQKGQWQAGFTGMEDNQVASVR